MANRHTVFEFFRYQIIPKSSFQVSLFDEHQTLSVEELKERKNEFFITALLDKHLTFFDSYNDELKHKILKSENDLVVLKLGKKKSIVLTNEQLEEEEHEDFPSVYVILNNDKEKQTIAISVDPDAFSNSFVVANILQENFSRICQRYNLEIVVNPILDDQDFWQLIARYQNKITQLKFNLIRPNLANISGTFKNEIRQLTDATNSLVTKVELNAPKDSTLENINEDNERIKALADYAIKGGSQYIHMKVKGIKKTIKTEKTIAKTTIESIELAGEQEQVIKTFENIIKDVE